MSMTRGEVRDQIRSIHFPSLSEIELPTKLLNKMIENSLKKIVTQCHTNGKIDTTPTLTSGVLALDSIADFFQLRYLEYDGAKLRRIPYENWNKMPTASSVDGLKYYYEQFNGSDLDITVINGDDETITVAYWAYPTAIASDATAITEIEEQFTDTLVDKVCWDLAKSRAPRIARQYLMSYRENILELRKYYIKKFQSNRGYVVPMDY